MTTTIKTYTAVASLNLRASRQDYNESWTFLSLMMMTGLYGDI